MTIRSEMQDWQTYWKTKKTNLEIPLGKHVAKDVITSLIRSFPLDKNIAELRILEVGCGEGHILGWLSEANLSIKPSNIVGIEKNLDAIISGQSLYPNIKFVRKDITKNNWGANIGKFDIILFINTLHEIFSSEYSNELQEINTAEGKKVVEQTILSATQLLTKGGYLLVYDGIEYCGNILDENITFVLNDKKSEDLFLKFCQEYRAYKIIFHQITYDGTTHFTMNRRDFSRFATKISLIDSSLWSIEKNESYQFMNENELVSIFIKCHLSIIYKAMFTSEIDKWNSIVGIEKGTFPFEHAIFVGKKM